ncbi:competence protein CoiA family protein [Niveibacterium sp.]|uniref:competence protein CoiA family protein n=1 Tax=Niveibacterium sp. TaxID=2017444 RepID=UPI0035B485B5
MSALLTPFARRTFDDQIVGPDEVERGAKCGCVCVECGSPVLARQGTEKEWHFAHQKLSDCSGGYAQSVHEAAKQLIRTHKSLTLPKLVAQAWVKNAYGETISEREELRDAQRVVFDRCVSGSVVGDVTPDVVANIGERVLLIEVVVFHRLQAEKLARLEGTGLACVLVDLSEFQNKRATRQALEEAIFGAAAHIGWLFHPRRDAAVRQMFERIRARAQDDQKRFDAERKVQEEAAQAREKLRGRTRFVDDPDGIRCVGPREATQVEDVEERLAAHANNWRASLPAPADSLARAKAFCQRRGVPEETTLAFVARIERRGDLAGVYPRELAQRWANEADVPPKTLMLLFASIGWLAPY